MQWLIDSGIAFVFVFFGGGAFLLLSFYAFSRWLGIKLKEAEARTEQRVKQSAISPETLENILSELKALKQQVSQAQDSNNEFNLSFDTALTRLEQRVTRVEEKSVVHSAATVRLEEQPQQVNLR